MYVFIAMQTAVAKRSRLSMNDGLVAYNFMSSYILRDLQ